MAKKETDKPEGAVEIPEYLRPTVEWDQIQGEDFGGSSAILHLEVGQTVGPLTYIGARKVDLGNQMPPAVITEARDSEGETYRMPLATNFQRQCEAAALHRGDEFYVRREQDAIKKAGAGKGNPMAMFTIKVSRRAPLPTA